MCFEKYINLRILHKDIFDQSDTSTENRNANILLMK